MANPQYASTRISIYYFAREIFHAQLRFLSPQGTILEFPLQLFEVAKFRANIGSADKSPKLFSNYTLNAPCATFLRPCRSRNIFTAKLQCPSTGVPFPLSRLNTNSFLSPFMEPLISGSV